MGFNGWADIGYNFSVGCDGLVYVGRGWNIQGAHTKGYNETTICIALIGMFDEEPPSEKQLNSVQILLEKGVKMNFLSENYQLYGHCQLRKFNSPGHAAFEIIKKWEHWSNDLLLAN